MGRVPRLKIGEIFNIKNCFDFKKNNIIYPFEVPKLRNTGYFAEWGTVKQSWLLSPMEIVMYLGNLLSDRIVRYNNIFIPLVVLTKNGKGIVDMRDKVILKIK